jgi:HflK protein
MNDAPALAAADVGIAVAGSGADIAAAAADVVDLNRSLEKFPRLLAVSHKTAAIIWQNIIVFAGIVNVTAVLAASRGLLGPVGAAVVHQIASFLVMVNSLRLLKVERPRGQRGWLSRTLAKTPLLLWWWSLTDWLRGFDPARGLAWLGDHRRWIPKSSVATAAAVWLLSGAYILQPGEIGIIERFGRKVLPYTEPGFHYALPFPIDRLHRLAKLRIRTIEIGFRTLPAAGEMVEPPAYEWNVQHRGGRFERQADESLMLTGDQNMIEMTAVVHYDLERPDDFVFQQFDVATTLQVAAESVIQRLVNSAPLDDLITTQRRRLEEQAANLLNDRLNKYQTGVRVLQVRFQDIHPSVEVVDAFREVAGALEEKSRLINVAQAYRNEQIALARGQAAGRVQSAKGYAAARSSRAAGDASRFRELETGYRVAPGPNATRLYLETMEEILPGRRKLILDRRNGGRRTLYSVEDNLLVMPPGGSLVQPPPLPSGGQGGPQ